MGLAIVLLVHGAGCHCYEMVMLQVSVGRKSQLFSSPRVKS